MLAWNRNNYRESKKDTENKQNRNNFTGTFGIIFASIFCSVADFAIIYFNLEQICIRFGANLALRFLNIHAETAPYNGAISDEFSELH